MSQFKIFFIFYLKNWFDIYRVVRGKKFLGFELDLLKAKNPILQRGFSIARTLVVLELVLMVAICKRDGLFTDDDSVEKEVIVINGESVLLITAEYKLRSSR